jgi:hypothetical protein
MAVLALANADGFADQRLGDEAHCAAPFDFAARANAAHLLVGAIAGILETLRIGSTRCGIDLFRLPLGERLVRGSLPLSPMYLAYKILDGFRANRSTN